MASEVTLSVRADLAQVIQSLQQLDGKLSEVNDTFKQQGKDTSKQFDQNVKNSETMVGRLRGLSRRLADQIRSDFKSLFSINALAGALKLSSQFSGSIQETVELNDTIRRLGSTFGIAGRDFAGFQSALTRGLGDIGLSSDVAARALEGLAETPVRGTENVLAYSRAAGQLAKIGKETGKEGDLARMMARVIQARGGNVNDPKQMQQIAQSVLAARTATGAAPSQILSNMEQMFTGMSEDFRKIIGPKGLATIAGAATTAGPNATAFIESFLRLSKTQRAGLEARGMGGLFSEKGFNAEQIRKFYDEAKRLGGGDIRLGLKAMGIESDEAAEGFTRLVDNLDSVIAAQNKIQNSTATLNDEYRKSMGLGDAFRANINKVKGLVAGPLATATQGVSDLLGAASESTAGAGATVLGGGLLAALLAGGALRGIGGGLGGMAGAAARGAAAEAVTGQKTIPVYVTNAAEIAAGGLAGSAGAAGGMIGKAAGLVGKAGMIGLAGAGGYAAGTAIEAALPTMIGKTEEGFEGGALERLFFKLDKLVGGEASGRFQQQQKVLVELNKRDLREAKGPARGASN